MRAFKLFILGLPIAASCAAQRAYACGASAGGTAGVSSCDIAAHNEAVRRKMRVGATAAYTDTEMKFSGGLRVPQTRAVALASFELRPTASSSYQLAAGAMMGGRMELDGVHHDFEPGFAFAAAGAWRVVDRSGWRPFVLLGAQLSGVLARTTSPVGDASYDAFDLRLSAAAGWTFARAVSPYGVGRVFGGPAYWHADGRDLTGTDAYHVQLGGGVSVLIAYALDVFVEGIALGERGVAAGAGWAF